jgi:hypothetical protein
MLRFRRVHDALRELVHPAVLEPLIDAAEKCAPGLKEKSAVSPVPDQIVKTAPHHWLALVSENAGLFYERVQEVTAPSEQVMAEGLFHERCREAVCAIEYLPKAEAVLTKGWSAAARTVLPSCSPVTSAVTLWAPVLAWSILQSFGEEAALKLFDLLWLRTALAEIFSTVGLVGEDAWRASARIRTLLAHAASGKSLKFDDAFWEDQDVRWLLAVNEAKGTLYFNKESFEQLLWWLQLPELTKMATADEARRETVIQTDERLAEIFAVASQAGYELEKFATLLNTEHKATATKKDETSDEDVDAVLHATPSSASADIDDLIHDAS